MAVMVLVVGLAGWSTMACATEADSEVGAEEPHRLELDLLLDARRDAPEREAALRRLIAAADSGDGYAQYVLGSLYRLGDRHPAQLLGRDESRAALYLSNAAVQGWVIALAAMAELRLDQGNAREAIVWTQLYIHYDAIRAADYPVAPDSRRAYAASLLHRCSQKLTLDEALADAIDADVAAFVDRHGASMETGNTDRQEADEDTSLGVPRLPAGMKELASGSRATGLDAPGMAMYLIGVNQAGRVEHVHVIDSLPDHRVAAALRRHARQLRLPAKDRAAPIRWALAPLAFDNHSIRLRSE